MEAVNGTQRQNGIHSIINYEKNDLIDYPYNTTKMAAAAVTVNSSYTCSSKPPHRYEVASSTFADCPLSLHNPVSCTDPQWGSKSHSDLGPNQSKPHRLSLPSIYETLGDNLKYKPPLPVSLPASHEQLCHRSQTPTIPRNFPPTAEQVHITPNGQRNAPLQAHAVRNCSNGSLEPLSIPSLETTEITSVPVPINSFNHRAGASRFDPERRVIDRPLSNHSLQLNGNQPYEPTKTVLMPPNSDPKTSSFIQSNFSTGLYQNTSEPWKKFRENGKPDSVPQFTGGMKRTLDEWDFESNLAEISMSSIALQKWSAHYSAIAQDKTLSTGSMLERLPSTNSVKEMKKHQQTIYNCLDQLTRIINEVHQHNSRPMIDQRSLEPISSSVENEEETSVSFYRDELKDNGSVSEAKKRRGRAAHPGKCHSCNRVETPEWRRGPDGARTLCNACGLHYAKLTRKNVTNKTSTSSTTTSLRPKSLDMSPRSM